PRRGRLGRAPDAVQDALDRHDLVRVQRERREQGALTGATEPPCLPSSHNSDRSEDVQLGVAHRVSIARPPANFSIPRPDAADALELFWGGSGVAWSNLSNVNRPGRREPMLWKRLGLAAATTMAIAVTAGIASAVQGPTCSTECISEFAGP